MAALLEDDDFDQFDKPGAERSRRRRTKDDDWDSELEDDLLEEDFLPGKKTSLDLSDEELNDDLLQSDEEDQLDLTNYSSQGVTISLNATAGGASSFDLSKSVNESVAEEAEYEEEETEEVYEETEEAETGEDMETYEENYAEAADEQVEFEEEEAADEVLDLEINEPLDEFQDEEYSQSFKRQKLEEEEEQQQEEQPAYEEEIVEDAQEHDAQDLVTESDEVLSESFNESKEPPSNTKEAFDEDDEDEEEEDSGRIRFKTERKEGTIIRLSDTNRERRNIPETLELSEEAKASLMEFEEMERQRKLGQYGFRRGGRRGGNRGMNRGMRDHRNDNDRRNMRDRHNQGQPIRSLFQQQQHIQPLLPMPRSRNQQSSDGMHSPQQEKSRMGNNSLLATPPQQPKNIHINPHFKGNVAPVQVPLLPVPSQPRPPMGPPRFPGMPDFQPPSSPVPGNFNQPPRLQEPWRNQPPPPPPPQPPQPEREPFFLGEPRFPNHHMFDQRNPPPVPPPPLMNNTLQVPNQNIPPFNPPGQGFNQPPRFSQPQSNFIPPGPQPGFNPPGPQGGFSQPGFNPPGPQPGFNQPGPQSGFNPPGPQPVFNPSGNQPGFNPPNFSQPGPQPGFNQSGPQPPYNPPGPNQPGFSQLNPGPQPGFSQPGSGLQPNFPQPGPGPQPGFTTPGFSRERPVRLNMPSPNPLGMSPFSQPPSSIRPFAPQRQQFPPGQPFMPHSQSNNQGHMQPPIQPLHQHHHHGVPPKSPISTQQPPPFRAQTPQTPSHRIPGQQRHGPPKPRQNTTGQNMAKSHNPQAQHQRNSNLRELPIAPSNPAIEMNRRRSAQVKPLGTATPQTKPETLGIAQASKPLSATTSVKQEPKIEEQFPDEDEETRKYRLKIEEQKRLREEILRQKELRRQQQAGARKKELLERLSQQQQPPPPPPPLNMFPQAPLEADKPIIKVENNSNPIMTHVTEQPRPNVKNRLVAKKSDSLVTMMPQKIPLLQTAGPSAPIQVLQKKMIKQTLPNRVAMENLAAKVQPLRPAGTAAPFGQQQALKIASVQGRQQEQRPMAGKRTVMQRSNSSGGDQAHLTTKVRVIKLTGPGENITLQTSESTPQVQISQTRVQPQQRIPPQQRQQFQQRIPQKTGPVRKVTLGKGSVQPHQPYQQQYQVHGRPLSSLTDTVSPQVLNTLHGQHPANKVIMRGRGRGAGGQMGRGRLMPNKPNLRVVECKPQPCVVSVEGLSSSTNENQLRNLLMSVGPIQNLQMFPVQRKAIAKFENPHHASQFQQRFHRHMIDLSHINVSLVTE